MFWCRCIFRVRKGMFRGWCCYKEGWEKVCEVDEEVLRF